MVIIWMRKIKKFTLELIKEKNLQFLESFSNSFSTMQVTVVLLKPSAVQRGILGEVITRFEKKGIQIVGMKMLCLTDEMVSEHYAHLAHKPFFGRIKESMQASPVVAMALKGVDVINVVRQLAGVTNGREAAPGTIRGDYSMSVQENIVHASDSPETAALELARFFSESEIFTYPHFLHPFTYANDEL
jgi:nucleoside-diphosphate kinase